MGGVSAKTAQSIDKKDVTLEKVILPRVFGVFFNQNQAPVFANKEVRLALGASLDKDRIVKEVLSGFGATIDSPIPPKDFDSEDDATTTATSTDRIALGKAILEKAGWKINSATGVYEKKNKKDTTVLSFSIATGDAPELKSAANLIAENWNALGAHVDVQVYETGDLNQNIIRPRKYDALFFGEIVGRDLDFYPFWHSSQRNDPGLNIALYVNNKVDKLLEDARATSDMSVRDQKYQEFARTIQADMPVVFVYSPAYLYVIPNKVHETELGTLTVPAERFLNINDWYIETNKIWKIFNKDNN
jgi:peptide/nickel transport system substrate-binding protein